MRLSDFSFGFALRITVPECILGVSDFVTTPIPPEIPPQLIGCHWILADVGEHAMPQIAGFIARAVEVCGSLGTSLEIGASTIESDA